MCRAVTRTYVLRRSGEARAMTSNVLKCSNCNVVINELLAFIQNKVEVMKDDSIVNLCSTAFSEEDIVSAKNLLFDSIKTTERNIVRRTQKVNKNIQDMVTLMRRVHPDDIPIFVARDLQKLPPVTFDHVDCTRLLKDIITMQQDINIIKEKYATKEDCDILKKDFMNLREASLVNNFECRPQFVNIKRGGNTANQLSFVMNSQDSGPFGILDVPNKETDGECESLAARSLDTKNVDMQVHCVLPSLSVTGEVPIDISQSDSAGQPRVPEPHCTRDCRPNDRFEIGSAVSKDVTTSPRRRVKALSAHGCERDGECENSPCTPASNTRPNILAASAQTSSTVARDPLALEDKIENRPSERKQTYAVATATGEWKRTQPDDGWVRVQRNRLKNRFFGQTGKARTDPLNTFKAADLKVPLFIDNVDKNASVHDICQYILEKTQLRVDLQKIESRRTKLYDSYKIIVPRHKFAAFMNRDLWPDGIIFRRFIDFNSKKVS